MLIGRVWKKEFISVYPRVMLCGSSVVQSFVRTSPVVLFLTEIPLVLACKNTYRAAHKLHSFRSYMHLKPQLNDVGASPFSMDRVANLCTIALSSTSPVHNYSDVTKEPSKKSKRKQHRESPEGVLRHKLDMCSKHGNITEALKLYDEANSNGICLNQHHYNVLLYLCSSPGSIETSGEGNDSDFSNLGLKRGFEIFQQMLISKVTPNEATFTSAARIAAATEDPEMAFDLVKQMKNFDIPPKLRSYGPALFGFCKKLMASEAYEVYAHMAASGVHAEEPEVSALLKLSAVLKNADRVYEMLHKLRTTIRQVSESSAEIIENWFKSEAAGKFGEKDWDLKKIKDGIVKGGGGWHGQGWLGSGNWRVTRTHVHENGVCHSCGQKLVCIDIDPKETENFAFSLTNLAREREVKAGFDQFQEWLEKQGPFDAIIDGANVGLVNQHNFNFFQLNNVVNRLREISPSKRLPLIILHQSRVTGGPALFPKNKSLLDRWKKAGALYATPIGSNDDWYWLYAAVRFKCLLVTNDEMRDHLFQLLGTSFFPRWKEKHQVRLSVSKEGLNFLNPPPYSMVIQESEDGRWHVPTTTGDDLDAPRQWLCLTRAAHDSSID